MARTIPSDAHVVLDTGHTTDHNNIADVLTELGNVFVTNTAYAGGADKTGASDSTAAFAAAFTAAASGGEIVVPAGTYSVTASGAAQVFHNVLASGMTIRGEGSGNTTIKLANSSNSRLFTQDTVSADGVTFKDICFDFNGSNQTDGAARDDRSGIFLVSVTRLSFENCKFKNGRHGAMLRLSVCDYTKVAGCRAEGMGLSSTFTCDFCFIRNSTHFRAYGNSVSGGTNPDTGFAQDGVTYTVVTGNVIDGMNSGITASASNTEGSSSAASTQFTSISGNTIHGAGATFNSQGIKVSTFGNTGSGNMANVTITGNTIDNCDRSLWIEQVDRCLVTANNLSNAAGTNKQMCLLSTTGTVNDLTIRGNKFYNTSNRGISFGTTSFGGRTIIEDNDFITVTTPIGGTLPSGTIIRRNPGYNPQGVAAITVTASPFTYTAGATPENVSISGGTVSIIAKNSITLFATTNQDVWLEPGESVTVTYSAAPTMNTDRK